MTAIAINVADGSQLGVEAKGNGTPGIGLGDGDNPLGGESWTSEIEVSAREEAYSSSCTAYQLCTGKYRPTYESESSYFFTRILLYDFMEIQLFLLLFEHPSLGEPASQLMRTPPH
jgi:hypothetical protein